MPQAPVVEVIPRRAAVCRDEAMVLDVLVRITPPPPEVHFVRPTVNLALVLDRSGSMAEGKKMSHARQAAVFAVEQLLSTDRVSVTVFDNLVETIVPGGPVADKPGLVRQINGVFPRGYTDLHGGWAEGARQAEAGRGDAGVNRVLLLSDGMANAGVTDPNAINAEVKGKAARGVTTTTIGVGESYNEDLLEAMARAGDGRYYYVESPVQLGDIFQTELQGLLATLGQKVSLGVAPAAGVTVLDVLNDLQRAPTGRLMLPNLVVGMPVPVLIRLNVPARAEAEGGPLCAFRLAWDEPTGGPRCAIGFELRPLPAVARAEWAALPEHPAVLEQEAVLMAVRAQLEASRALERGDIEGTRSSLSMARLAASSVECSPLVDDVLATLGEIETHLDTGEHEAMLKKAKYGSYSWSQGRSDRPNKPPEK
jgi:Ca-activated chloride channel homolog